MGQIGGVSTTELDRSQDSSTSIPKLKTHWQFADISITYPSW